jgi:hypothetical protein
MKDELKTQEEKAPIELSKTCKITLDPATGEITAVCPLPILEKAIETKPHRVVFELEESVEKEKSAEQTSRVAGTS